MDSGRACFFMLFVFFYILPFQYVDAAKKKPKPNDIEVSRMFEKWGTFVEIDSALDVLAKDLNDKMLADRESEKPEQVVNKKRLKKPKQLEVMAKITSIGKSAEKRNLRILSLGRQYSKEKKGQGPDRHRPEMMIMATMHGREHITPHAALFVAWRLVEEYKKGTPKVRALLDNGLVHILPFLNPDGYEFTRLGKTDTAKLWRKNRRNLCSTSAKCAHGIDLNRNWGVDKVSWGFGATKATTEVYQGKRPFSEPELKAIGGWLKKNGKRIDGFMDVHCCSAAILPPFYYHDEPKETRDKEFKICKKISKAMKSATPGIRYRAKRRETEWGESNTGIGVDWIYGEAGVKNVYIIETRGNNVSHKIEDIFEMTEEQILQVSNEVNAGFWALAEEVINFEDLVPAEHEDEEADDKKKDGELGHVEVALENEGSDDNGDVALSEGDVGSVGTNTNVDLDSLMQEFNEVENGRGSLRSSQDGEESVQDSIPPPESVLTDDQMAGQADMDSMLENDMPEEADLESEHDQAISKESDLDSELDTDKPDEDSELESDETEEVDAIENVDDTEDPFLDQNEEIADWQKTDDADGVNIDENLDDALIDDTKDENELGFSQDADAYAGDDDEPFQEISADEEPKNMDESMDDSFGDLSDKEVEGERQVDSSEDDAIVEDFETRTDKVIEEIPDFDRDFLSFDTSEEGSKPLDDTTEHNIDSLDETDPESEEKEESTKRDFTSWFRTSSSSGDNDSNNLDNKQIEMRFLGPDENNDDIEGSIDNPFDEEMTDSDETTFDSIRSSIESSDRRMAKLREDFENRKSQRFREHRNTFGATNTEADALLGPDFEEIDQRKKFEHLRRQGFAPQHYLNQQNHSLGYTKQLVLMAFCGAWVSIGVWRYRLKYRKHPRQD